MTFRSEESPNSIIIILIIKWSLRQREHEMVEPFPFNGQINDKKIIWIFWVFGFWTFERSGVLVWGIVGDFGANLETNFILKFPWIVPNSIVEFKNLSKSGLWSKFRQSYFEISQLFWLNLCKIAILRKSRGIQKTFKKFLAKSDYWFSIKKLSIFSYREFLIQTIIFNANKSRWFMTLTLSATFSLNFWRNFC